MTLGTLSTRHGKLWRRARKAFLALSVKHPALRKVRFWRWKLMARRYDAFAARADINEHSIVFECFGGRQFGCSPKALYLTILDDPRFEGWTLYWSFRKRVLPAMQAEPLLERAQLIVRGSEEYFAAFARSKYWIQNNRVPEYVTPRDGQVYVQCWHGTPFKRLGCDVPQGSTGGALNSASELALRFRMDSAKWSHLLAPSSFTARHLCDAFGLPQDKRTNTVLVEGYPRNDFIRTTLDAPDAPEQLERIRSALDASLLARELRRLAHERGCAPEALCAHDVAPERRALVRLPRDKHVLLYAPTFRDDQYTPGVGYSLALPLDLDMLQRELGSSWVILLRMHYYIANRMDLSPWEGFAYNVSSWPDVNELYVISDALCTDYSSACFDYANTGRPLYFLWPDLEHFGTQLHGFYLDPFSLPGPKCRDTRELLDALSEHDAWQRMYGAAHARFRETFCPLDDGRAAQRVVERVFAGV